MKNRILILGIILLVVLAGCENEPGIQNVKNEVVTIANITGVVVPVTGETPVIKITETEQYTGTVEWSPNIANTFAEGTEYTATIYLSVKDGYTLDGVTSSFFQVAGAIETKYYADGKYISVKFPATAFNDVKVTYAYITGVIAPERGETPVLVIGETEQYTGTVAWSGNPVTFEPATVYTVTIHLTAKSGYTLQGVTENFFVISGVTATNSENSGVITATYPITAGTVENPVPIYISSINGVTIPVDRESPSNFITSTALFSGTITWSPGMGSPNVGIPPFFSLDTQYTATIVLTPNEGYTLTGVDENFFAVAGAITTNEANAGVITAIFPACSYRTNLGTPSITNVTGGAFSITVKWSRILGAASYEIYYQLGNTSAVMKYAGSVERTLGGDFGANNGYSYTFDPGVSNMYVYVYVKAINPIASSSNSDGYRVLTK